MGGDVASEKWLSSPGTHCISSSAGECIECEELWVTDSIEASFSKQPDQMICGESWWRSSLSAWVIKRWQVLHIPHVHILSNKGWSYQCDIRTMINRLRTMIGSYDVSGAWNITHSTYWLLTSICLVQQILLVVISDWRSVFHLDNDDLVG